MEVRLLGPVAVADGDGVVPVRQRRQRALLALLALRAGETLAADRLVEELWGAEAPRTAVASLHNAVSQLRKLLGADALLTRDSGYLLDTEQVAVDVTAFEHLLGEARAARSMQDEVTAGAILREALGLWHGRALADLAYEPFAQAEIRRLEELHQTALEERIDADLALGRHLELVPELESLVAHEPLRERLQGQLMLALYRAGRQADALGAYRAARATLVEELGIEPGPELRRLQAAILRQDDSLLLSGARPTAAAATMQFRRLATILVADVVTSSHTGELDPEALHRVLGRWYETVAAIVRGHGAAAERMAGDAVMAAFGVATSDESHALRAVRAAVDIRVAVERMAVDLEADGTRLDVRIGIATGEVLASGTSGRQQLVTGEAIGVAAALQQAAGSGDVVIGPLTRRLLGAAARVEPLGDVALAGRGRPVPAFCVLGVSEDTQASATLLDGPLVGRMRELRTLRAALREARAGPAVRAVCVLGVAGVGKSRLAREIVRGARGFDVLVGRCPSYGQGITYWPLRQIVGDDLDAIRAPLGDEPDDVLVTERLTSLDGTAAEIARAFTRWCDARARRRPLLVVLDDVHWAEPTFLELVEHLVDHAHGPLALLALAREELLDERPAFLEGRVNATRITLDGLAVAETQVLVEQLLGGAPLPIDVRARVFEAADGNPLFVEQFVALLGEGDALVGEEGLPATIQALLAARLDRLGPGERAVLERAAVVGREFTSALVEGLLDAVAVPTARRHLDALTRRGFVQARGTGSLRFRHVLVQEAAYRATPKSVRADLHERLADRLDRAGDAGDELVGYHLERAYRLRTELAPADRAALRLAEDAGRRLGAAGVRAWQRFDTPAAVGLLERAAALLPGPDAGRLELLSELAEVFKWRAELERAGAVLREVEQIAASIHDTRLAARARIQQAWPRFTRGETSAEEMLELAAREIPVFEAYEDERALGLAWRLVGAVHGPIRQQWALCADAASRASEHYERAGFSPAQCLVMLGVALKDGPEPVDSAIERCEQLVASARSDPIVEAHMRVVLADLEEMRGNTDTAREHLRASIEVIAHRGGGSSPDWAMCAGRVEVDAGDFASASAILESACDAVEQRGEHAWVSTLSSSLAEVRYQQGMVDTAFDLSTKAMTLAPDDDLASQLAWRRVRAKALARTGAFAEAERLAREAIGLVGASDALDERATTLAALAEVLRLAHRHAGAEAVESEALALFERKGNTTALDRATRRLSTLRPAQTG